MDVKEFFARNPLFNRDEWLSFRYSCGKARKSASQLLRYYYTRKRLVQVHNGLFAVVIPGTDAAIVDTDPFDICMKVASDPDFLGDMLENGVRLLILFRD